MKWIDKTNNCNWKPDFIPLIGDNKVWIEWFDQRLPGKIEEMRQTKQDSIYHGEGDVWVHTKMVVEDMLNSDEYNNASLIEKYILWMSALLHDVAKPSTTREDYNGKIIAPGHSKRGSIDARILLWEDNVPLIIREQICNMITYHQTPFFAIEQNVEFLTRKISLDCDISLLSSLARSDIRGRICPDKDKTLDNIQLFYEMAKELDCADKPFSFSDGKTASYYVLSHGKRDAYSCVYDEKDFEVIVLSGLPATGKDTWCEQYGGGLEVLSYDKTRERLKLKQGQSVGEVVHSVTNRARELLRERQSFIWNATHLSQDMRMPTLSLIRQYGGSPKIVCLEAGKDEILNRNNKRDNTLTNKDLLKMIRRWEYPKSWEGDIVTPYFNYNYNKPRFNF